MPEILLLAGAVSAGACAAIGVTGALAPAPRRGAAWLDPAPVRPAPGSARSSHLWADSPSSRATIRQLSIQLRRAGMRETPQRVIAAVAAATLGLTIAAALIGGLAGLPTAVAMGVSGCVLGPTLAAFWIRAAVQRRHRRLLGELAPLLELLSLELSSGAPAVAAMEAVLARVDGDLPGELRRLLVGALISGAGSIDSRLTALGDELDLPALRGLATIIAASREYGTGLSQGVRSLAIDLRRAQRRNLIADSRRALNRVLVPAALGVLGPFLAVLLYPALITLSRTLA